jgi:chaperonin GroES
MQRFRTDDVRLEHSLSRRTCRTWPIPGLAEDLQEEPSVATATKTKPARVAKSTAPSITTPRTKMLRPLGDRVVIQPAPHEEMTKSGIVIPDTAKEKPQEGKVQAVGPGRMLDDGTREQMDLKRGDTVLYAKYAGTEFKLEGEDLLIISAKDVLAVVER